MGLLTSLSGCPAWPAPRATPRSPPSHPLEFPVQGWGPGLSPSRATSCVITIFEASVSSSRNGMMLSVPLRALRVHVSGGTEASLLTCGLPVSALSCIPVSCLSESTFSSSFSPFLQTSLPNGPLISPLSQIALDRCPLLPQPLQLDANLPPARGSSAMVEPRAPTEAHRPLGGCPSDSPFPARELSQRKPLAAEAGGGGHFSFPAPPRLPASLAGHTVYYSKGGIWSAGLEMGGHSNQGWPGSGRLGPSGLPPLTHTSRAAPDPASFPAGLGAA